MEYQVALGTLKLLWLIVINWGNVNFEVIKSALCLCLRYELLWEFGHHFGEMKKKPKSNPNNKNTTTYFLLMNIPNVQMFLASSFGSEIAHSQVRPVTLQFGTCDS